MGQVNKLEVLFEMWFQGVISIFHKLDRHHSIYLIAKNDLSG